MNTPRPDKGTLAWKFCRFFVNRLNFCEGNYYDGTPKPQNRLYEWFWNHWLWPFDQNECICCNTVRGLIYGFIVGYIAGIL